MKTCEEMLFGISIDEHVLFKASLVLLCLLSLFLILISILIVWLRKIQRQIVYLTKNTCSLHLVVSNFEEKNSWKNLVGSAAYGPWSSDGDGLRSNLPNETSFDSSLAQENEAKSVHGSSNTQDEAMAGDNNNASNVQNIDDSSAAHYSTSNDSEQNTKGDKLKKDYMSLKGATNHTYANPGADASQMESKMGCDQRQNGKALKEEKNQDTHEDDHGYLVVIHSDKSSALSEGTEDETPPHEDESLYLIPIESKPEEDRHHKIETESDGKSMRNGVSNIDDSVSPLDDLEEYAYPSSQHVGKLTTFGHTVEFQQTQPGFTKDADVDDSGYLIVQHAECSASGKAGTSIPVGPFQAGGTSENDGLLNATHGDDNNYEYIPTKDWTELVDNSDSTTGKAKPVTNSSGEDNHGYLTVGHETEVNSSKEEEHFTDQIYCIIHDGNNNNNAVVQSEVAYVNQNVVQNLGVDRSDDVPVYANNDAPHQTSFCNVDESPLYDNP